MAFMHRSNQVQRCSGSTERLEMSKLNGRTSHEQDASYDAYPENDEENEGERALLVSESGEVHAFVKMTTEENTWHFVRGILIEAVPTLTVTTFGLAFTGELLQRVSRWRALKRVNELYILIPMLNNLKGNLEMNLSSRLSTSANIGELNVRLTRREMLSGSLSLLQVQALLVSAVAAILSFLLGLILPATSESSSTPTKGVSVVTQKSVPNFLPIPNESRTGQQSGLRELGVLLSTAMASASLSGLILGSFMCTLVLICRRLHRDPDNITPPIASCLGDLLTLCIISLVSSAIVRTIDTVLPLLFTAFLILGTIFAIVFTIRNKFARQLIFSGWMPLLGAMLISACTGMVLDHFVTQYKDYGLLSVVLNGLPGAVGSIHISRLSTSLHASTSKSIQAADVPAHNSRKFLTTMTLFLVTLPVQVLFLIFLHVTGWANFPPLFIAVFFVVFCGTVFMSLAIAQFLTQFLWRRDFDPDSYALPIHSSIVDLLGQLILVVCYEMAQLLGADVKAKPGI